MSDVTIHGGLTIATVLYDLVMTKFLLAPISRLQISGTVLIRRRTNSRPKIRRFWKQGQGCKTRLMTG